MTIRAVIVDDQSLMRVAFRTILEAAAIEVVGEAFDGDSALALVTETRPDVVVMDIRMPGRDGLSATQLLARGAAGVRVLVLTTFDLDEYVFGALDAGASGFLLKNSSPEELVAAVQHVAAGEVVLDPAVTGRVLARLPRPGGTIPRGASAAALATLTEREKDVFTALVRGMSNAEIAAALDVGEATAKTHVSRVLTKLGVRDRVHAVILAYEAGLAGSDL